MKIKVIDLLNKIANVEEVPRTIRWYNKFYNHYDEISNNYKAFVYKKLANNVWGLNDEVEIIEEPKKIEHCLKSDRFLCDKDEIEYFRTKIDELIDEINNLKEKQL